MAKKQETDDGFVERMLTETITVIEEVQLHILALDHAGRFINAHNRLMGRTLDMRDARSALMEIENNEWRKLMMWGLVAKPALRERIKAAAKHRFLSSRSEVLKWLRPDHIRPSSWVIADEEELRKMIDRTFSVKAGEGA